MPLTFEQLNQEGDLGKDNLVGILHIGKGGKDNIGKEVCTEFRVTSNDPDMLTKFAEITNCHASDPIPWGNGKLEMGWETFTDCSEVTVLFDKPEQIEAKYWVWSHGQPVRTCDGGTYQSPINAPWRCYAASPEQSWAERKAAGHVCRPRTYLRFRLAGAPEAGIWELQSSSFQLVNQVRSVRTAIDQAPGPLAVKITLSTSMGRDRLFVNPVLEVLPY